jgi:hypothetical protein
MQLAVPKLCFGLRVYEKISGELVVLLKYYEKLAGEAGASPELSFIFKKTSGASP